MSQNLLEKLKQLKSECVHFSSKGILVSYAQLEKIIRIFKDIQHVDDQKVLEVIRHLDLYDDDHNSYPILSVFVCHEPYSYAFRKNLSHAIFCYRYKPQTAPRHVVFILRSSPEDGVELDSQKEELMIKPEEVVE